MKMRILSFVLLPIVCIGLLSVEGGFMPPSSPGDPDNMVRIPAGDFTPFYQKKKVAEVIKVKEFLMDVYAVTNADFLQFVKANPQWGKSKVKRLFADTNYLSYWSGDFTLGKDSALIKNSPVTNVSWFAANAYAQWKGKRLPSVAEWEYAAQANDNKAITKLILEWYEKPNPPTLPNVGSTFKNKFGLFDMYGLIWEWVNDFNNRVADTDSRSGNVVNLDLFCSDGSLKTASREDYASYMRYAFRFSLRGSYCVRNLGFRCVRDINK